MNFDEALQTFVKLPYKQKLELAVQYYMKLLPTIKKFDSQNNGLFLINAILGTAMAADGKMTVAENELASAVYSAVGVKVEKDKILEYLNAYSDIKTYGVVYAFYSSICPEEKGDLVTLIALICAIDDNISKEEYSFITDLRAYNN